MVKIGVIGAAGRMGVNLINAIATNDLAVLAGGVEADGHPKIGVDASLNAGLESSGILIDKSMDSCVSSSDVIIDFTHFSVLPQTVAAAVKSGKAIVIGTTALGDNEMELLEDAAKKIPVVLAANYSMGVNLLSNLVKKTAAILGSNYDVEIVEAHHHHKKDAPSGTAIMLGKAAAEGLDIDYNKNVVDGRSGDVGARPKNEIGMHAVRGGDVVGEHTVTFFGDGERIELTHKASSRIGLLLKRVDCMI